MTGNLNEGDFERLNVERRLTAYFDNELEPAERAEIETMLAENPDLRGLLDQWQKTGDSLRQLPGYGLGADFTAGVQAKIDAMATAKSQRPSVVASSWDSQKIGMSGIVALAALLLLTLFVFPSLVGDGRVQQADLVVNEKPAVPLASPPKEKAKPILAPRNISLPRTSNRISGATRSRAKSRGIEQVLLIQNAALSDLEAILKRHEIRIVDSNGKSPEGTHFIPQAKQGMEAIHIVSHQGSMQSAINEIADHESIIVTAFTIPGQLESREIGSSRSVEKEEASALQLQPIALNSAVAISREIEELDQWFKLGDEAGDREPIECLLLIQTVSQR